MSSTHPPTNSSTCEANFLQTLPYHLSCGVPLLSNSTSPSTTNITSASGPHLNNNTALLTSCCSSNNSNATVAPFPPSFPGDTSNECYIYCNNSDMAQALQTYWCLGNLSVTTRDENVTDGIEIWGCDLSSGAVGRRGGSGGLGVVLGMGAAFWVLAMWLAGL